MIPEFRSHVARASACRVGVRLAKLQSAIGSRPAPLPSLSYTGADAESQKPFSLSNRHLGASCRRVVHPHAISSPEKKSPAKQRSGPGCMSARRIFIPIPARTPGATNPDITQENIRETICNPRWSTKSIRPEESYTHRLKIEQIAEYGYSDSRFEGLRRRPFHSARTWRQSHRPKKSLARTIRDVHPGRRRARQGQSGKLPARRSLLGQPDARPGAARNCGGLVPRLPDVRAA